jgi:hypothetical protein
MKHNSIRNKIIQIRYKQKIVTIRNDEYSKKIQKKKSKERRETFMKGKETIPSE